MAGTMPLSAALMMIMAPEESSLKAATKADRIKVSKKRLTSHCHVACFVRQLKLRRIARHLTAVGARRLEIQVIQMNCAEFIVAHVLSADMDALHGEDHVLLLRRHERRISAKWK
jgi:hypothetical protein